MARLGIFTFVAMAWIRAFPLEAMAQSPPDPSQSQARPPPLEAAVLVTDRPAGGALKVSRSIPAFVPYPAEARARSIEGVVILTCAAARTPEPTCRVDHERPTGEGFGAAARAMARAVSVAHDKDTFRVPIVFAMEGSPLTRQWTTTLWEKKPTARSFDMHYPAGAAARGIGADTLLSCAVREDRRLDCEVVSETPAGLGFGSAAVKIARDFRMSAAATGPLGMRVGDTLLIPIGFRVGN